MEQDEAPPPPYSAVDPLRAQTNNRNGDSPQSAAPRHGNSGTAQEAGSSRLLEQSASSASSAVPTHFTSAVTYFEERPPTLADDTRDLLPHHMTIYPRSQAKDFPRRPRCWASRSAEIAQQDWDTFLRYLFPAQLGLAAASQHLPRQLRAEIQRDRKDRPQETDEQRRSRIAAVVDEWNQCFFEPRAARINFVYVGEPDAAPTSALCPRCYPAATRATQSPAASVAIDNQAEILPGTPSPVTAQHAPPPNTWPMSGFPSFPGAPPPMAYGTPFGTPQFPIHAAPHNGQPPQYYPAPAPPPGVAPWQWNPWYNPPQFEPSGASKDGTFGWISSLTSKVQKYGERFAEQAQHYGDQISAQAMHYGREFEEHAMARRRWLEEQARLQGWEQEARVTGYHPVGPAQSCWSPAPIVQTNEPTYNPPTSTSPRNTTPMTNVETPTQVTSKDESTETSRRPSVSSNSSDATFSSIDTLSTTSDLSTSDLAAVRTQLQSLHDHHDRTLYEAAVDLRRQLSVLQESRHEARTSGRDWRAEWRRQQSPQRADSTDWGRWESPQQRERQSTKRRVLKQEMRATKKAFRDVVRRAREEQRDRRRAKKHRRRRAQAGRSEEGATGDMALDGRMQELSLDGSSPRLPARSQTMPISQAAHPQHPVRSETSSEMGVAGVIHSPSSASRASALDPSAEAPDKKGKLKGLLTSSRKDKKQPKASEGESSKKAPKKDPSDS